MIGVNNDVESRMDAYRGNPQALMQRYSQSQELVDLLALQKLKSEKEAAAREMQMQMESAGLPTVAQQREKEVMDLTKKEVAQQSGLGGQQKAMQQQQAMQKLMQAAGAPQGASGAPQPQPNQPPRSAGLAGLASPNMMPPKAMASGGIVAFADGGNTSLAQYANPDEMQERFASAYRQGAELTPEERALRERQIEELRQADEGSEKRRRSEGLTRWLLGAANRSGVGSTLAGAGAAATNYQSEMDDRQRARMLEMQKRERGMSDEDRAIRMGEAEAGIKGLGVGIESLAGIEGNQARIAAAKAGRSTDIFSEYGKAQIILNRNPEYKAAIEQVNDLKKKIAGSNNTVESAAQSPYPAIREQAEQLMRARKAAEQIENRFYEAQGPQVAAAHAIVSGKQGEQSAPAAGGASIKYDAQGNRIN